MADKVTYQAEVNDDKDERPLATPVNLKIGSRDGAVFVRLAVGDSRVLVREMTAQQAQEVVTGLLQAIRQVAT